MKLLRTEICSNIAHRMKKLIFCLSFVVALVHSTYSKTVEKTAAHSIEIIQQETFQYIPTSLNEDQDCESCLLEDDDNDDVNTTHKNKITSNKGSFLQVSFAHHKFPDGFIQKIRNTHSFFYFTKLSFASIRVLRL